MSTRIYDIKNWKERSESALRNSLANLYNPEKHRQFYFNTSFNTSTLRLKRNPGSDDLLYKTIDESMTKKREWAIERINDVHKAANIESEKLLEIKSKQEYILQNQIKKAFNNHKDIEDERKLERDKLRKLVGDLKAMIEITKKQYDYKIKNLKIKEERKTNELKEKRENIALLISELSRDIEKGKIMFEGNIECVNYINYDHIQQKRSVVENLRNESSSLIASNKSFAMETKNSCAEDLKLISDNNEVLITLKEKEKKRTLDLYKIHKIITECRRAIAYKKDEISLLERQLKLAKNENNRLELELKKNKAH